VSESALGIPTQLLSGDDREQETRLFNLSLQKTILVATLKKYAHCLFAMKIKCNEARMSNGHRPLQSVIDRDRETAVAKEDSHLSGNCTVLPTDSFLLT